MYKFQNILFALLFGLMLSGCGGIGDTISEMTKGKDNAIPPTPLTEIQSTLDVSTGWSRNVGKGGNLNFINLKPMLADNQIFVASRDGTVMAIDAENGSTRWEVSTKTRLGGGPGVGDSLVLLGSSEGEVIALSIVDGKELWRSRVTSEVLSVPAAAAGVVVARAIDGRVFGLSAIDGRRLWTYDRTVPTLTLRGSSSPVIAGGLVVYGSDSGKLSALSLKEGLPLWEKSVAFPSGRSELDRIVDIDGNPLVINGVIYAASYQGRVIALELETARTIWSKDVSTSTDMSADRLNLYVSDAEGNVWALDRRTGASLWKQDKLQYRAVTGPVVIGNHVVVSDFEGYQHWLSSDDGHFVARVNTASSGVGSTAITDGNMVYSYSKNGELTATRGN
jgi:outer membrane protein assembly factor BamB